MASEAASAPPIVLIQPSRGWRALDLRELWRFRELVYFLALRDIKVRYKQTALGVAWVLLQPLLALNPMTGVIEAFRWSLLGVGDPPIAALLGSMLIVAILLSTGLLYFRRMERTFADVI